MIWSYSKYLGQDFCKRKVATVMWPFVYLILNKSSHFMAYQLSNLLSAKVDHHRKANSKRPSNIFSQMLLSLFVAGEGRGLPYHLRWQKVRWTSECYHSLILWVWYKFIFTLAILARSYALSYFLLSHNLKSITFTQTVIVMDLDTLNRSNKWIWPLIKYKLPAFS